VIWNKRLFYELVAAVAVGRRWLDLGCGRGVRGSELQQVRERIGQGLYVGVDPDWDSLADNAQPNRVCASGESMPFPDGAFGLLTSDMVFEHLEDPIRVLAEAHRVLNDDGILVIHAASSVHYTLIAGRVLSQLLPRRTYVRMVSRFTGRDERDIFPTRYAANTARKFARAAGEAGFDGGFVTHLPTPLSTDLAVERLLYRLLPQAFRSTLLAVYFKRTWAVPLTVSVPESAA
jgi:ubiquinone/menaquinone biosynthesis C-methylase UbiE